MNECMDKLEFKHDSGLCQYLSHYFQLCLEKWIQPFSPIHDIHLRATQARTHRGSGVEVPGFQDSLDDPKSGPSQQTANQKACLECGAEVLAVQDLIEWYSRRRV
jgi:hypothetical protein